MQSAVLTLPSVVAELLAIPAPNERLPLDLLQRLVWHGRKDLHVCTVCGTSALDVEHVEHGVTCGGWSDVERVPAWGLGVVSLLVGVANWGVSLANNAAAVLRADPAKRGWQGPGDKSGKHMVILGGGLGVCDLDSGGLGDAYERWGYPDNAAGMRGKSGPSRYLATGKPIAFDRLRTAGGPRWAMWLTWADALLARPEFHEWLIGYWLREFWAPSWEASMRGVVADLEVVKTNVPVRIVNEAQTLSVIRRACMNARIRNSAKGWGKAWAHLPADEQARRYVEAKREARGDSAAKRTERQVGFARRAAVAIEAVRVEVVR